jgi:hypothetical protein
VINTSLTGWLRGQVAHDALLNTWQRAVPTTATDYESDALALSALAIQSDINAGIGHPGGRARLPLLAAVHAAALQLAGYPSPFAPPRKGPVVLVTRQVIRRVELENIDGAGVPICPAIRPARVRSDALCVPLHGGRARLQTPFNLLLLTGDLAGRPMFPPAAVIIDGANVDDAFLQAATSWARELGAPAVVFDDAARRRWPENAIVHSCGWSAINAATSVPEDKIASLAPLRGHVAVADMGPEADLAAAAALLTDARRRGSLPPALVEAATLWRRLDEMVVPLDLYDAACPRWHTAPISERLDDLSRMRASDFPSGWRTWAEACWAGIKDGLNSSRSTLTKPGVKAAALVHLVDEELLAGQSVDVALPSRTARDSVVRYLAEAGVLFPEDGRLTIRSLGDVQAWGPPRTTLLAAPPTRTLRHRFTAADVGALNVLCYTHETGALLSSLRHNLDEPLTLTGPVTQLGPAALTFDVDLPASRPAIVLSALGQPVLNGPGYRADFAHLAAAADIAALAALTSRPEDELSDLPGDDVDSDIVEPDTGPKHDGPRAVVPITVVALGETNELIVRLDVQRTALRVLANTAVRIPVLDIQPSMLIADIAGPTAFERLRPMLLESRGQATKLFLAAWDQALHIAEQRSGGTTGLSTILSAEGSTVGRAAVASWSDADRIGPRSADDVARVGKIAEHPVVTDNSAAIAAVMVHLRSLHQAVGRAVADAIATNSEATDQLDSILGSDAVAVINETIVYRVIKVGMPTVDARRQDACDDPLEDSNREKLS